MRFSEIIGDGYFGIKLTSHQYDLLDKHFLAASHHRNRWMTGRNKDFHNARYFEHLSILMSIVSLGDFSRFFRHPVLVKNGFDKPSRWRISLISPPASPMALDSHLFDPGLFSEMHADIRWQDGEEHPYDVLIDNDLGAAANISLFQGSA